MRIKLNEAMLSAFDERRSYFTMEGNRRWQVGAEVDVVETFELEGYNVIAANSDIPSMGCFSYSWSPLSADAKIGRYCSISWNVSIISGVIHPFDFATTSSITYDKNFVIFQKAFEDFAPVEFNRFDINPTRAGRNDAPIIGHDVWIGHNAVLARGIIIGNGAVVAAHSVVTKSVPPFAMVGGNPAQIIRMRFDEKTIERLMAIKWWNYNFVKLGSLRYNNIHVFLDELEFRISADEVELFVPPRIIFADLVDGGKFSNEN